MMIRIAEVQVTWIGAKAVTLPSSLKYITVAKFDEDGDTWEKEAWSIVLEFKSPPVEQGNPSRGIARFLADDAPVQRFKRGKKFEMYEGRTKTADVLIL